MDAVAQVTGGASAHNAGRAAAQAGKQATEFKDSLRDSIVSGSGTARLATHRNDEQRSKQEQLAKKDKGPDAETGEAAPAKVPDANASAMPAGSAAAPAAQTVHLPALQSESSDTSVVTGVQKADAPPRGKGLATGTKKDGASLTAKAETTEPAADKALATTAGKAAERVGATPAGASSRSSLEQVPLTPGPALRLASMAEAKSSSKLTAESSAATHRSVSPQEYVHTLEAAPNVLEVGLASTAHGWLRVRAELGGTGEVTAQVVAASAGAAENLHKELPLLSAYLSNEHVAVSSLTVNAAGKGAEAQDAAMSFGSGKGNDAERGSSREAKRDGWPGFHEVQGPPGMSGMGFVPGSMLAGGSSGGWLSVRV